MAPRQGEVGNREPAGSGSSEVPADDYRRRIFDHYVSTTYTHRADLSEAGVRRNARNHHRLIGRFLPEVKDEPILEIGSGNGGLLLCLREQGYTDVTGLDISPEQVELSHARGFDNMQCADGLEFLLGCSREFGLIVMSDVLEHLPKAQVLETLVQANAHLRAGGRIILRVPNMSNPLNVRTRYVDLTHEVGFSKETLQQVLRVAGFEVETVHGAFQTHQRWWMRFLFDILLWRLFQVVHKRVLHLPAEVVRGKNLVAVGRKPASAPVEPRRERPREEPER